MTWILHGNLRTGEDYYKLQRPRTKRQDRLVTRPRRGTWILPYEYPGQVTRLRLRSRKT